MKKIFFYFIIFNFFFKYVFACFGNLYQAVLAYSKYKSKDLIDILNRLEKDRERVLLDLPVFYMIEGREITRISKQEALYKMYPEIEEIEKGKKKVVRQVESNQEEDQAI